MACAARSGGEDFYAVLGVERTVDSKALKAAFRKLALKYHPDVNSAPDAADRFRRIKAAYTTLSDPELRQQYDRQQQSSTGSSGWGRAGSGAGARQSQRPSPSDFNFGTAGKTEEFYGLGDFFRDLDKELSDLEARRETNKRTSTKGSGSSNATDKSLLEELAAIGLSLGEELVEFLESGISSSDNATARSRSWDTRDSASSSSSASKGDARRSTTAAPSGAATSARTPPPQAPPPQAPPPPAKASDQSVDDMLRQLKKDMGLL